MATYAIGDVQGCYHSLMNLLEKIQFNPSIDTLWFTGDLVNRGPQSLETLRFIHALGDQALTVLGNHDLTLLAVASGAIPFKKQDTFSDILEAKDKESLLSWLEKQPLIHHNATLGYTLIHAGLHPAWDLNLALDLAKEVQDILKSHNKVAFYQHLHGNTPENWDPKLMGWDRLRCIVNYFTRIRLCDHSGKIHFNFKESMQKMPPGFLPWFLLPNRLNKNLKILFGHWAALQGQTNEPNVFALDTGCVWGNSLTAMRLEDEQKFTIPCLKQTSNHYTC